MAKKAKVFPGAISPTYQISELGLDPKKFLIRKRW
jgi:hypothetical protein